MRDYLGDRDQVIQPGQMRSRRDLFNDVCLRRVTREHRENLAKVAKQLANKAKESLRRVRSGAVAQAKRTKEGHSEDIVRLVEKQVGDVAVIRVSFGPVEANVLR